MQANHRMEMKYRPQFTSGNFKVLDIGPRSSRPAELCSLHYEKRGCSSVHIPPTMQMPSTTVHGKSGSFISLELFSAELLKKNLPCIM